jgi:hypothetical protein
MLKMLAVVYYGKSDVRNDGRFCGGAAAVDTDQEETHARVPSVIHAMPRPDYRPSRTSLPMPCDLNHSFIQSCDS